MSVWKIVPHAVRDAITHVRKVVARVTPEQREQRLAICRGCPKYTTFLGERCGVCHCPLVKVLFERAHCPDNPPRW